MYILDLLDQFFCKEECRAKESIQNCGERAHVLWAQKADSFDMPGLPMSVGLPHDASPPGSTRQPNASREARQRQQRWQPPAPPPPPRGPRRYGQDVPLREDSGRAIPRESDTGFLGPPRGAPLPPVPPPVSSFEDESPWKSPDSHPAVDGPTFDPQPQPPDAVAGKGLAASMRRGVALAKEGGQDRADLAPHKDGGFISTIQRGFESFFGQRPLSKEEVLRMRGLTKACEYDAVPGDEIDQQVQHIAHSLPQHLGDCVKLFRVARGEYELELSVSQPTEMLHLSFGPQEGTQWPQLFVQVVADRSSVATTQPTPPEVFSEYLLHSANIAYSLEKGGNAVTQVPNHLRMSFADAPAMSLQQGSAEDRYAAMALATRQASMREQAAVEWTKRSKSNSRRQSAASEDGFAASRPEVAESELEAVAAPEDSTMSPAERRGLTPPPGLRLAMLGQQQPLAQYSLSHGHGAAQQGLAAGGGSGPVVGTSPWAAATVSPQRARASQGPIRFGPASRPQHDASYPMAAATAPAVHGYRFGATLPCSG